MASEPGVQSIEDLRKKYDGLRERKIRVGTQLEESQRRLDELKLKSREEFGTDDVEQLKAKLEAIKSENDEKRKAYQASLEEIETRLAEVEQEFVDDE